MPCYHPLKGWHQPFSKAITFKYKESNGIPYTIPCGRCVGCRISKSRQWAMRCMHEASLWEDKGNNSFITLTYSNDHLPKNKSLNKKHFQLFMKRLRKKNKSNKDNPIRYYHCGEYGDSNGRPHYHAILFNKDFSEDRIPINTKNNLFTSEELSKTWGLGENHCQTVGLVSFASAAYVSRYILKKQYGDYAIPHYVNKETGEQIEPEYSTMSRNPGIAHDFFTKYKDEIYHKDFITMEGFKMKPPKYYDELMLKDDKAYMLAIKQIRMDNFDYSENSPERLAVKKACTKARLLHLKREI